MIERITRLFRREKGQAAAPAAHAPAVDAAVLQAQQQERERQQADAEQRLAALARQDDRTALIETALHDRSAKVRLAAAEKLQDPADLERLRRDSSDKNVQRHAREALKAQREQQQQQQETQQRITQLLEALAQHANRSFEPLYDAKLESLADSWRAIAGHASAAEQERYSELAALARDTVARHAAEIAAREGAIAAKKEMIAACTELESVARQLSGEDLSSSLAAVAALRSTQQTRWDEAVTQTAADAPLAARFRRAGQLLDRWLSAAAELSRAGQDVAALLGNLDADDAMATLDALDEQEAQLDALRARIDWPAEAAPAALLLELDEASRRLAVRRRALQADVREQLAQLRKRRGALRRMIDEGQLRVAVRTHQWLLKRIGELPAREAAQETTALAPLAEALAKLHDWYQFASVPKKEELCVAIEALAGPVDDISERATAVRELRARWNTLCAADPDADPELRARFDRAADAAFAPCAAWYDAQHRLQDDNLAKRAALCDALATRLATPPADIAGWRELERHERDLRAQWKTLEPVRWPEARATQDRFHALLGQLRAQLDGERQRGVAARRALIERATALLAQEPLESALNAARGLQDEWKRAGWADPRDDRGLWQEFRTAVDAVFARRDAARDAERSAREAAAAEAAQRRAEEEAKREQKKAAIRAARQAEIDAALALADAESAALAGAAGDYAGLQSAIDTVPARASLGQALRARLANLVGGTLANDGVAANAEKLAALTLELEILLDLPSPPELAAARMQAKIAKLNTAMRQRATADSDPRRTLEDAWLATGPLDGAARTPLLARFRAALAAP